MKVRLHVFARLDDASRAQHGTVVIDRETGHTVIRARKRRRTYELNLSDIATLVVRQLIRQADAERRKAKAAKRKR